MDNPHFLTDEQVERIKAYAYVHGNRRRKQLRQDFSEVDFIAGAMVAFFALGAATKVPAGWIFGVWRGDSQFDDEGEAQYLALHNQCETEQGRNP